MANRWLDKLLPKSKNIRSFLRHVVSGSLYRVSDLRSNTSIASIRTTIDTMRALAEDSQISTALSFYATDATTANSAGNIIWATPIDPKYKEVADVVNQLFKRWNINAYARDHILELATVGNLYIPTTYMYKDDAGGYSKERVALDNNTIPDLEFDILPAYKIPPEDIVHLWHRGNPQGYIYQPQESMSNYDIYSEGAFIHFSLGGLLGEYKLDTVNSDNEQISYDIQFATPLLDKAVQPTRTLSLLEDANVLASLARIVKFINVDCGTVSEEEEIRSALQDIKDAIEQQLSINTNSGDAQSYVNPQSPNNLIYLPKVNGADAISVTDLNMAEASEQDSKLLDYYQNKKLSVIGIPKEAMNFSSNEGLGGAGSVLSQRSALYANSLARLSTAYINGWTFGINTYFATRNMSGFVDKFQLHMNPILTEASTISFDRRDSVLTQASTIVDLLKTLGVDAPDAYKKALKELLIEALPQTSTEVNNWNIDVSLSQESGGDLDDF